MTDLGIVYKWTNLINGKIYIGSHKGSQDDEYTASGIAIKNAFKKYGFENFKRDILYYGKDFRELEEFILEEVDAINNPLYYNMKNGAIGGWDHTNTPEIIQKRNKAISDSKKGIAPPCAFRSKVGSLNSNCKKILWKERNKIFKTTNEVKDYFKISTSCFHRIIRKGPSKGNSRRKDLDNVTLKYIK
jgi:group I intron endonuclease